MVDRGDESRPSWRTMPDSANAGWRRKQTNPDGELPWIFKLGALVLFLATLFGYFAWKVIYAPKALPLLVLSVTDYVAPIPPNSQAIEDLERFSQGLAGSNVACTSVPRADDLVQEVRDFLNEAAPGGPGQNWLSDRGAVAIYISAHGVVDENGVPFLLPANATMDSDDWLPVETLLDTIVNNERLKNCTKLLMFDSGKLRNQWSLGVVENGFAVALRAKVLEVRERDPLLFVLNSTQEDQRAHVCPEFSGSFFGAAVALGLGGAADTSGDNHVSVSELGSFVTDWVHQQVHKYRTRDQRPALIPNERIPSDATLAFAGSETLPMPKWSSDLESRHSKLQELWDQREKLLALDGEQRPYVVDPLGWAELNNQLVRLEVILLAGDGYSFEQELSLAKDALARFNRVAVANVPDAVNSRLSQRLGAVKPSDVDLARTRIREQLAKPTEPLEALETALPDLAYDVAAWQHLAELETQARLSNVEQVLNVLKMLREPSSSYIGPSEIYLLGLLREHARDNVVDPLMPNLIQTEDALARATAEGFERSHHWFETELSQSAEALRQVRDLILVGETSELAEAKRLMNAESNRDNGRLHRMLQSKTDLAKAELRRDFALSQLADLALWHLETDPGAAIAVSQFTTELQELCEMLIGGGGESPLDRSAEVAKQNQLVTELHRSLSDKLLARAGELSQVNQLSATNVVDAERLLMSSVVPAAERKRLRLKFLRELQQHRDEIEGETIVFPIEGAASKRSPALLTFTQENRSHPALEIFAVRSAPGFRNPLGAVDLSVGNSEEQWRSQVTRASEIGGLIRQYLKDFANVQDEVVDQTRQELSGDYSERPRSTKLRRGLATADLLARSAAPVAAGQSEIYDVCRMLRQLDRQLQLLWEADRLASDFCGPRISGQFQFARQSEQIVRHVAAVPSELRPRRLVTKTRKRIQTLIKAAEEWQPPSTIQQSILDSQKSVETTVGITGGAGVPAGVATYEMKDDSGDSIALSASVANLSASTRLGLETAQRTFEQSIAFPISNMMRDTGAVDFNRIFRGHVAPTRMYLRQLTGPRVSWQRPSTEQPTVHVINDGQKISLVLFVLDCSYSMAATHEVDGIDKNRLQIARSAIVDVLNRLDKQTYRVGLMAYGHRINLKNGERIWPGWKNGAPEPKGVKLGEDVELLIRQEIPNAAQFDRTIAGLKPFGRTPLAYSIKQGWETLLDDRGPNIASRHVVVLTDGADDSPANVKAMTNVPDGVKLSILYCGFPQTTSKSKTLIELTKRATQQWADNSDELLRKGAQILNVQNPAELVAGFEEMLQVDRFCVVPRGQGPLPLEQMKIVGATWPVKNFRPGEYVVYTQSTNAGRKASSNIKLDGGERVLLQLDRATDRYELVYPSYGPEGRSGREQRIDNRFVLIPQRTDLHGNGATIRISLQETDQNRFTARPTHVWAEVRPLPDREPVVFFQDCEFERNQPVPVVRLRLDDFPFREAEVKLWFAYATSAADVFDNSVADLADGRDFKSDGANFKIRNNGQSLFIIESAEESIPELLFPRRVAAVPEPDRITRQYDVDGRQVTHEFLWDAQPDQAVRLRIGRKFKDDWFATEPIEVSW